MKLRGIPSSLSVPALGAKLPAYGTVHQARSASIRFSGWALSTQFLTSDRGLLKEAFDLEIQRSFDRSRVRTPEEREKASHGVVGRRTLWTVNSAKHLLSFTIESRSFALLGMTSVWEASQQPALLAATMPSPTRTRRVPPPRGRGPFDSLSALPSALHRDGEQRRTVSEVGAWPRPG